MKQSLDGEKIGMEPRLFSTLEYTNQQFDEETVALTFIGKLLYL